MTTSNFVAKRNNCAKHISPKIVPAIRNPRVRDFISIYGVARLELQWLKPINRYRAPLIRDLDFDEFRKKNQRFLPAEIAGLGRDVIGHAFLHDVQLGPA